MPNFSNALAIIALVVTVLTIQAQAGIIKDLIQKVTNTNNKTEGIVKQSAPICGNGIFSTLNKSDLSPEIIFITNRQSRALSAHERSHQRDSQVNEVAKEFRFHPENVTLRELEHHGFNPDAPVSFLMHGFTSGYPLQAWISAIVEAYTIDREISGSGSSSHYDGHHINGSSGSGSGYETYENLDRNAHTHRDEYSRNSSYDRHKEYSTESRAKPVDHNLFIVNWNYAARGIIYPRAVANIPTVASYVARFINEKLIDEAHVEPRQIQLIGHSLGAHLAGFIGKNTRSKIGRIYGLDPAGPCFGTISGPLYPPSKRLVPSDAEEVITIQTNSALLGIDKPLGKYSVYVEGGANQPGCKTSGVLKSLGTLTFDGGDFDTVACSHSRAPNLITYRHDQRESDDNCLMVAYACKDWESFTRGQCGVCSRRGSDRDSSRKPARQTTQRSPLAPVECLRIGLDWQYSTPDSPPTNQGAPGSRPIGSGIQLSGHNTTRRPLSSNGISGSRRPFNTPSSVASGISGDRSERAANKDERDEPSSYYSNSSYSNDDSKRRDDDVEAIQMFLRTSDTQPYCVFHYQIVLELNEPFEKEPAMSIILQDSRPERERRRGSSGSRNSISSDEFGHKFDDRTYTHLLTSYRKLRQIDHGTLIIRDGLKDGHRVLKAIHVNYMSHSDPLVRRIWSSRLCPVKTDIDREAISGEGANKFYFKPCDRQSISSSASSEHSSSSSFGSHHHYTRSWGDREYNKHNLSHYVHHSEGRDREREKLV